MPSFVTSQGLAVGFIVHAQFGACEIRKLAVKANWSIGADTIAADKICRWVKIGMIFLLRVCTPGRSPRSLTFDLPREKTSICFTPGWTIPDEDARIAELSRRKPEKMHGIAVMHDTLRCVLLHIFHESRPVGWAAGSTYGVVRNNAIEAVSILPRDWLLSGGW